MRQRNISFDEIIEVVERSDGRIVQTRDKVIHHKKLPGRSDNEIAVVIVSHLDSRHEVLTVMHRFDPNGGNG